MCPGRSHSKLLKSHLCWRDWRYAAASHTWWPRLSFLKLAHILKCLRKSEVNVVPQTGQSRFPLHLTQKCAGARAQRQATAREPRAGNTAPPGPSTAMHRATGEQEGIPQDCPKRQSLQVLRTLGDECLPNREQRNFISSFTLLPPSFLLFILWGWLKIYVYWHECFDGGP